MQVNDWTCRQELESNSRLACPSGEHQVRISSRQLENQVNHGVIHPLLQRYGSILACIERNTAGHLSIDIAVWAGNMVRWQSSAGIQIRRSIFFVPGACQHNTASCPDLVIFASSSLVNSRSGFTTVSPILMLPGYES